MNKGSIYLLATPIGNLEDITLRVIRMFKEIDILFCEDTRVTKELLKKIEINYHQKKFISSSDINEKNRVGLMLDYLAKGFNIGITTDRGTPIISDPGYALVKAGIEAGYSVISLPGPSAIITAITTSGLEPDNFMFLGFLKGNKKHKINELEKIKSLNSTLIFYESPHHLYKTLKLLYEVLGDRKVVLCRELTKMYETIIRSNLKDLINDEQEVKGEFVIVVEGCKDNFNFSNLSLDNHVKMYLDEGYKEMDALKKVAQDLGVKKSEVYKKYHLGK